MATLCSKSNCRLIENHKGKCNAWPKKAWSFLDQKDQYKLDKAGYATPRGGDKGAYQNHVYRNNKVIIPFEKLDTVSFANYEDGYVIRAYPDQIFDDKNNLRHITLSTGEELEVGINTFVLYRSHQSYEKHPPLSSWKVRYIEDKDGNTITRRTPGCIDKGHYVLRLPTLSGSNSGKGISARKEGPPQGIFAPEYANTEMNYLSQAVLAWQIVHAKSSPYASNQASHLKLVIEDFFTDILDHFNYQGMMKGNLTTCPLCLRTIDYKELHQNINLDNEDGLLNSGAIVEGTNRSTIINLFHMIPLSYEQQLHRYDLVSWGHATCNTKLGQRICHPLDELKKSDIKVAKLIGDEYSTFGWISLDERMIRSPLGAVWIKITNDCDEPELEDETDATETV